MKTRFKRLADLIHRNMFKVVCVHTGILLTLAALQYGMAYAGKCELSEFFRNAFNAYSLAVVLIGLVGLMYMLYQLERTDREITRRIEQIERNGKK